MKTGINTRNKEIFAPTYLEKQKMITFVVLI